MIAIIDYGMGNLKSVFNSLKLLGIESRVVNDRDSIMAADRAILPGVGAFGDCREGLLNADLWGTVNEFIQKGKPLLGICVGMQLLYERSYEFGVHEGFGIFSGDIVRFNQESGENIKIPHMGWNNVRIERQHPLFNGIPDNSHFYFVHSYYAPCNEYTAASCEYGVKFSALTIRDNVAAVQFHPEKSQTLGLALLKNFGGWIC